MKQQKNHKKYFWIIGIIVLVLIAILVYFYINKAKTESDFNHLIMKTAIVEKSVLTNNIKISNNGLEKESYSLRVVGLEGLVNLDENNFILEPGEEKNIKVTFNAADDEPDVYVGEIIADSESGSRVIPVILEIQSKEEVLFDSNLDLFPKGEDIIPGEKLTASIKIYDLANLGKNSIDISYFVRDFEGNVLISESENLIIDGTYEFSKSLDLPDDIKLGYYVLGVVIKYGESTGTSSLYFKVVEEKRKGSNETFLWIIILAGFFFFMFLVLFIYSIYSRDKLLREIQKQYSLEIRRQRELINSRQKKDYRRLKTRAEKKEYKKEVKKIRKQREKYIKKEYKTRVIRFKALKKKNDLKALKKQVAEWKAKGYNTQVLEKKYKMPKVDEIHQMVREWKKKGYDTSLLEKNKI